MPTLTLADGRTMFPNGGPVEVPGPILDSSFSFHSPTGRGAVYTALARRFDDGFALIGFDLRYWSVPTLMRRQHDIAAYISLTTSFDTTMTTLKWSSSTGHALEQLGALEHRMTSDMRTWMQQGLSMRDSAYVDFTRSSSLHLELVNHLRATLDLPPS